ncbi:hypothetical protein PQX77_020505 [Marasmius sp. AFHP31]|nr:hypothetical protein PQX77_020505 [Marasmius sp. AFHP31]
MLPLKSLTPVPDDSLTELPSRATPPRQDPDSTGRSSRKAVNGATSPNATFNGIQKKVAFISPSPTQTIVDRDMPDSRGNSSFSPSSPPLKTTATHGKEPHGSTSSTGASSSKTDLGSTSKGSGRKAPSMRTASPYLQRQDAASAQSLRSGTPYSQMSNTTSGRRILSATSWSEVTEEDLVSNLGSRERTRQEVLFEIISSEERYANELAKLKETFTDPLLHPYLLTVSVPPLSSTPNLDYDYYRLEPPAGSESADQIHVAHVIKIHQVAIQTADSMDSDENDDDQLGKSYSSRRPGNTSAASKHNHPWSPYRSNVRGMGPSLPETRQYPSLAVTSFVTSAFQSHVYHGRQPEESFSKYVMDATLTQVDGEATSLQLNYDEPVFDDTLGLIMAELKKMRETVRDAILMRAPSLIESDGKTEGVVNLNGFTGFTELNEKDYEEVKFWYPHLYEEPNKKKDKKAKGKGKEKDSEEEAPAKKGRARRAADENVSFQFIEDVQGNPVPGQRVTAITRDARSFYASWFKKGLITSGGWDQISPLVRIAFYILMRILAPELTLCYGNWKADRIGKKTFPGWWQNHRYDNEGDEEVKLKVEVKEEDSQMVPTGGKDGAKPIDVDAINVASASTSASTSAPALDSASVLDSNDIMDIMMDVATDGTNAPVEDATSTPDGTGAPVDAMDAPISDAPVEDTMVGEDSAPSGTKRPRSGSQTLFSNKPGEDQELPPPSKRARSEDLAPQAMLPKLNIVLFKEVPLPIVTDDAATPADGPAGSSTQKDHDVPGGCQELD